MSVTGYHTGALEMRSPFRCVTFVTALALVCAAVLRAAGCASLARGPATDGAPVTVAALPLGDGQCSGTFAASDLPHEIEVASPRVFNYDSLGAGLAVGDLDNDGDLDPGAGQPGWTDGTVVEPNRARGSAGSFRREELTDAASSKPTSAVLAVDANADGWLDLAFTHSRPPTWWRNDPRADGSGRTFVRDPDFAAGYFAHVMDWAARP